MKWLLILSVILNGVLAWQLLQKKEVVREEIVEKVVVKKAAPEVVEKKVIVKVPGETVETVVPGNYEVDEVAVEDEVTSVNKKREDFLVGKLGFTEKDFQAIEAIKKNYIERFQKIYKNDGVLTLAKRRELLELEEERDAAYARAVGKEKWKEWENYRDEYNSKLYKRSAKEQTGVIVPMEI